MRFGIAHSPTFRKMGLLLALGLMVSLNSGCFLAGFTGIQGSGVSVTENRETEPFNSIDFSGAVEANIQCGAESSVQITVDDNLIDIVKTRVRNETLDVSTAESYSTSIGLNVDIGMDELKSLEISGAAKANILDCETDELKLSISGASKVTATGTVDTLIVDVSGAAKIDLSGLTARIVKLEMSGASKADVHATESLDVEISGVGSVKYSGDAEVTESISGLGKVTKVDSE